MNIYDLMKGFWEAHIETPPNANECKLYFYLLNRCNSLGWKNPFTVSTRMVTNDLGFTKPTLIATRNRLREKGLLDFEQGQMGVRAVRYFFPENSKNENKSSSIHSEKAFKSKNEVRQQSLPGYDIKQTLETNSGCQPRENSAVITENFTTDFTTDFTSDFTSDFTTDFTTEFTLYKDYKQQTYTETEDFSLSENRESESLSKEESVGSLNIPAASRPEENSRDFSQEQDLVQKTEKLEKTGTTTAQRGTETFLKEKGAPAKIEPRAGATMVNPEKMATVVQSVEHRRAEAKEQATALYQDMMDRPAVLEALASARRVSVDVIKRAVEEILSDWSEGAVVHNRNGCFDLGDASLHLRRLLPIKVKLIRQEEQSDAMNKEKNRLMRANLDKYERQRSHEPKCVTRENFSGVI